MQLRTHIVVTVLLACGGLSSWAAQQQQEGLSVLSSSHSYSDRLKAAAETNGLQGNAERLSPAVYEQQLRQLSDDAPSSSSNASPKERQASSSSTDGDGNRFKTSSKEKRDKRTRATNEAGQSYKEQLRRLASEGDGTALSSGPSARSSPNSESPTSAAIPAAATPRGEQKASTTRVHEVSLESPSHNESIVPVSESSAPQSLGSSGCIDSYCRHLSGIAEGAALPTVSPRARETRNITTERNFIKNLAFDQVSIWSSPFRMHDSDATWAVPFGIVVGSLIATDRDVSKQLVNPDRINTSKKISNFGLYSFIGAGAGFYGLGLLTHDDHKRETGLLSGEAFINATLLAEVLKLSFGRERPFEGDHFGHIGKGGSSFPSGHAIDSWSIATVFAHEYPSPFMKIAAYGLASTVSIARITANQHYASDVLVGSAFGYLIGQKIYKDHHNPELPGAEYGTFVTKKQRDAAHSGSAYVPLESWVYGVIDRLAALGIVKTNFDSERPFTRLECARLTAEAAQNANYDEVPSDIRAMVDALQDEFSRESEVWTANSNNRSAEVESVYTRMTEITGPVLRDGYHFGQTIYNDYGRPYGRGFNNITGFSARATSGPVVLYFRGEYQHAPGNPNYTAETKNLLFIADGFTPQVENMFPPVDRFSVLDAYIGLNFSSNLFTLGRQSLFWGPGTGGSFMVTNNAKPLDMVRLSRVTPLDIPLLSKLLGPLRYDVFVGQTSGYHYILDPQGLCGPQIGTQPFVQGQRFTFKPTPNFEFGLTKTGLFGGTGYPLTAGYFFRTTFTTANYEAGSARKPGDRRSGVDVTYRIPKLRNWLTWYAEEFSEDETSPIFFPRTSAMRSGIYAARLPWLPNVDLRIEGLYTDVPGFARAGPGYFYWNATYRDGFTKDGDIMGSWIGRNGRGVNAASTVWLSAKNSLQFGYREAVVDPELAGGGRYQDGSIKANFEIRPNLFLSGLVQYENWRFPALANGLQVNVASSLQITYTPKIKKNPQP